MQRFLIPTLLASGMSVSYAADVVPSPDLTPLPVTTPEQASQINGIITLYGTVGLANSTDADLDQSPLYGIGTDARITYFANSGFGIQGEFSAEYVGDYPGEDFRNVQGGAHLLYTNAQSYSAGLFGGIAHVDFPSDNDEINYFVAGAEAAYFAGGFKAFAQIGYADTFTEDDTFRDVFFGRAGASYAFTDRTAVFADATYAFGDTDGGGSDEAHAFVWGASIEHQFLNEGLSGFVGYEGNHFANLDEDNTYTDHNFEVGFKFRFGASSIASSEQAVPFDLPSLGKAFAVSEEVD